jgi:hypothetical protein
MTAPPDWTLAMPMPLVIPKVMTLTTLGDVREWMKKHLPPETRAKSRWQHVAKCIESAARGGNRVEASAVLRMVLSMERVECRPK